MKKTTDIYFYINVSLICAALLLTIVAAIHSNINQPNEYERGYIDGFMDGMRMNTDYGTVKLEGGEE